jgi:hypothetical protein
VDKNDTPQITLPPCSICGAGPEKRKWSKTFAGGAYGAGDILLVSGGEQQSFWTGPKPKLSQASPVVCTQCGYVQFFVRPEDFRDSPPS